MEDRGEITPNSAPSPQAIEAVLRQHPAVLDVLVRAGVAHVVADLKQVASSTLAEWGDRRVSGWQLIWDRAYGALEKITDPRSNFSAWTSSYTGGPIDEAVMRDWVDETVQRLQPLPQRRVLELGCGSGLLLHRLAPTALEYVGCDLSAAAIAYLQLQVNATGLGERVRLLDRPADRFDGLPGGHFDLVILNSVAMYFPSLEYLTRVLDGAARAARPGGIVFAGDIRNLGNLRAFWASVKQHKLSAAPADPAGGAVAVSRTELRRQVDDAVAREAELLVDPDYFRSLPNLVPRIAEVSVQLKRGVNRSEMNRFRYDAILRVGDGTPTSPSPAEAPPALDWPSTGLTLAVLAERLGTGGPASLRLVEIPDARLASDCALLHWLDADGEDADGPGAPAIEPDDVRRVGHDAGHDVEIEPPRSGHAGRFDALLWKQAGSRPSEAPLAHDAARRYSTEPLLVRLGRTLLPELERLCKEQLGTVPKLQLCASRPGGA